MTPDPAEVLLGAVWFQAMLALFIGLCLGSFATALSWRVPRGVSIVKKSRSSCPACGHDLSALDLVPLFSWIFLRGKCRYCRARVGWRYPVIELCTVGLCLAFYFRFGFHPPLLALWALAPLLVSLADIDFRFKILPDGLNLSVAVAGFAALFLAALETSNAPDAIMQAGGRAVMGAVLYGGLSFLLRAVAARILKREPMGLGDVKFFAAAGVWLGPSPDTLAYFMAISGLMGIVLALGWKKATGEEEFPFGPALLLSFVVLLIWGQGMFIDIS